MRLRVALSLSVLAVNLSAAHAIVGTWKQNRGKAERSQDSKALTIEPTRTGISLRNAFGHWFTADFNEKETPVLLMPETRVKLKRLTDLSFEMTFIANGKRVSTSRIEASPDGKTLTQEITNYNRSDGKGTTTILTSKRTAGSGKPPLFAGTWETDPTTTKYQNEDVFTATQKGDVLTFTEAQSDTIIAINLKSGDTKLSGTGFPTEVVMKTRAVGDKRLEMTWTQGKLSGTSVYEVSSDGNVLTQRDTDKAADGKTVSRVLIYERQ